MLNKSITFSPSRIWNLCLENAAFRYSSGPRDVLNSASDGSELLGRGSTEELGNNADPWLCWRPRWLLWQALLQPRRLELSAVRACSYCDSCPKDSHSCEGFAAAGVWQAGGYRSHLCWGHQPSGPVGEPCCLRPATPLQHPEFAAPHSTPSPPHLNCGESPTTRTLVLSFYPAFFLEENGPKKLTLHYVFAFQKLLKILPTINTYLTVKFHASLGKQFWDTALSWGTHITIWKQKPIQALHEVYLILCDHFLCLYFLCFDFL